MPDRASIRGVAKARAGLPTVRPTRRQFLAGGAALAFLAACGGDDSDDGATDTSAPGDDLSVLRFFGPYFAAGAAARVPFGLADSQGQLPVESAPDSVGLAVRDENGQFILEDAVARRYHEGLPRAYYTFEVTPEKPGIYDMVLDVDGAEVLSQFQVVGSDNPTIRPRVDPGEPFPKVQTPTVEKPMGVTPICTRNPPCDLHSQSIDGLLGSRPIALMISTPAFCQIGICGPVLDLMLNATGDYPDVAFFHTEVYKNPSKNSSPPVPEDFAAIIGHVGVAYEPVFYTVGADGKVASRLDYIFAEEEIRQQLDALA